MIVYLHGECGCVPGRELRGGAKPEFYGAESVAAASAALHQRNGDLYFALHVRGRHVLKVKAG